MNSTQSIRPTARLSCNANTHLEVIASEEDPLQARPGNSIQVALTGRNAPFEFAYSVRKLDGSELVRTIKDVAKSPYTLPVDYIGTYKLLNVTDSSCAGTIDASECTVSPWMAWRVLILSFASVYVVSCLCTAPVLLLCSLTYASSLIDGETFPAYGGNSIESH